MKIKLVTSSLAMAALCGSLHSQAQPTTTTDYSRDRDAFDRAHLRLGKLEKADKICGTEVKNQQDQKLGKVKDLAIDLRNGRIVEVIVATGGVLGVDEHYVAVPPEQFTCDPEKKTLVLNIDPERLKNAPSFKMSAWEESVRQPNVTEAYQYYSTSPYFNAADQPARTTSETINGLGEVERSSKVIGTSVRNNQDEKLGKVENLVVDLPAGRIVEVVLASGGFLGMGDELSAVPPQSFHRGVQRDLLLLDTTKDALSSAPHFKAHEWPNLQNPDYQQYESVYRAYNVSPYFSTNAVDNTAQNVRDRQQNALTPFNQGNSDSDMSTTKQIRQLIIAHDELSLDGHNVKVITIDGKVTLRGPVDSPEEKQQIDAIAKRIATGANVDDQLEVKGAPNSVK